ncbi:hypothetical protein E4U57_004639 [Claviceps arundinis]|uniref:Nitrilase n=1 Tax=Claviceps arundinis TaxID=1623583 RepID=A0ABQ7PIZ5_9HYPO|nr:hypothetical protein E4U57_004639 [Claviceps arundinis]
MVGRKRNVSTRGSRRIASAAKGSSQPNVYAQMLAEAHVSATEESSPARPLKRRRPNAERDVGRQIKSSPDQKRPKLEGPGSDEDSEEDMEFEDVLLPTPTVQTMEADDDDDDDDEDDDAGYDDEENGVGASEHFQNIDFTAPLPESTKSSEESSHLQLNLTAQKAAQTTATSSAKRTGERRKPLSKAERENRVQVHQAHLVCLLAHVARRNHWCNDGRVQDALRSHLSDKASKYLTPSSRLTQFGQAESLKNGLKQSIDLWKTKFIVTERGLRRALWAEDVEQLEHYELPSDMDSCLDRAAFRDAAKQLQGSRDVGAQLYCAMLRSVGVRARLVCSLQPLACTSSAPPMPNPNSTRSGRKPTASTTTTSSAKTHTQDALAKYKALVNSSREDALSEASRGAPSTARRRLGHPNAAAYDFQPTKSPAPKPQKTYSSEPVRIRESAHPIYWVEVLDKGHQKWQPVDPVVTHSFWKLKLFEPPITDRENNLSYVVAFEADGTAKDVTRRYAKAFTAKTRKLRIDTALDDGSQWWRKVMKPLQPRRASDLDQIEDNELAGFEAREPMPKNVQDFKDHPVYALERHLRRHEALALDARPSGTLTAGAGSRGTLEKIYRRKDVLITRSTGKWYRMGRLVKPNEIPVKWIPKRARPRDARRDDKAAHTRDDDEDDDGLAGIPLYSIEQTELYEPPPVRNGRVPKNKFGNIDVYVPSMIPQGGVHIIHEHAARAAHLIGVDYAPALTGFSFQGRHGTAVLRGIVVAREYQEALQAVLEGIADVQQEMEDERRGWAARKTWRRLLMGLRIRERIWSGVGEEERREAEAEAERNAESEATDEFDMVVDEEDGGGGFLVE